MVSRGIHPHYRAALCAPTPGTSTSRSSRSAGTSPAAPTPPRSKPRSTTTRSASPSSRPNYFGVVEPWATGERDRPRRTAPCRSAWWPRRCRWRCSRARAPAAATSPSARPSRSACRSPSAARTSASWPPARSTSGRCPGASRARPWTSDGERAWVLTLVDPRAAHPAGEGDLEHLHQPGAVRARRRPSTWRSTARSACGGWRRSTSSGRRRCSAGARRGGRAVAPAFDAPVFNEFDGARRTSRWRSCWPELAGEGVLAGVALGPDYPELDGLLRAGGHRGQPAGGRRAPGRGPWPAESRRAGGVTERPPRPRTDTEDGR